LTYWWEGDVLKIFIGSGFNSSAGYIGMMAHSDFVGFLHEFGLLGFSLYLIMLGCFHKAIKNISNDTPYLGYLLMMCFIILVGRGIFAGTIRTDNVNLSITIGYLLAITVMKREERINN
jgi:hypothetical protein